MYPIAFTIGDVAVPSYFLILSVTCCLCMVFAAKRADFLGLSRNIAIDLCLLVFFLGLFGARFFHVVFEYPVLYMEQPERILRLWEGGFVFYGGALFSFSASVLFLRRKKQDIRQWLDLAAPVAAFSYAMGRIGCFLAGCCYGKACQLPWAVVFPRGSEGPAGIGLHPTQLYATLWESAVLLVLVVMQKTNSKLILKTGDLFWIWVMLHGLGRIFMELFRADYRGQPYFGMSISTWISLCLMVAGAIMYLSPNRSSQNEKS